MTERVFRIEHPDGHGICEGSKGLCGIYHQNSDHRRGCGFDTCFGQAQSEAGYLVFVMGWKFAFPSKEAVGKWFPLREGRCAMKEHGGVLREYEVDAAPIHDVGNHQVIFDADHARLIAEHSLEDLDV